MGGVDRAILKIESFSHAELDTPEFKDKQRILAEMRALPHVPIDESFPLYVRENQERFKKLGFIDEEIWDQDLKILISKRSRLHFFAMTAQFSQFSRHFVQFAC